ncbi:MAG: hypothetical protein GXY59_11485 [Bacteroidales bacterium]|jgi:hypothetical protein|nr:hypothetical protein [Bacteroidales bacterium]
MIDIPSIVTIGENDRLLRRVQFLHPNFIKPDGTPSSASFSLKTDEKGLSVDLERLTSYEKSILDKTRFRLFYLSASFTVQLGLINQHDPQPDNYAHTLVMGNISRSVSRQLAAAAKRIYFP